MRVLLGVLFVVAIGCGGRGDAALGPDGGADADVPGADVEVAAPGPYVPAVRSVAGRLVDPAGREVLLRGVNARVAGIFDVTFDDGRTPLETIPPFGEADCRFLAEELGMNLLRLPVNWSGIEPERDRYDTAYLDRVFALVDTCAAHGVYTLLDLHQDAWSKEIGEDGAPLWAIVPTPTQLLQGPLLDLSARRGSEQVLLAFQSFLADEAGLWGEYGDMAAELVRRVPKHPGAIGLELMNEPVALLQDAELAAFHDAMTARVRQQVPELMVVFEPNSLRNISDKAPVRTPLPHDNAVYAPHIYTDVFEDGWASEDEGAVRQSVRLAREEATAHGAALMVSEFGHDMTTERGRRYVRTCLDAFDAVGASWALWVYEEWSQDSWGLYDPGPLETRGALRGAAADLVSRPYPVAIDGHVEALAWNPDSKTLTVTLSAAGTGEHIVSAPRRQWPDGIEARCDGQPVEVTTAAGRARVRCQGTELRVAPAPGASSPGR